MTTLANRLNQWNSDTLKKYVDLLGGTYKITRKGDRINYICALMLDKPSLNNIWQQLDTVSQRAISTAYYTNGEFDDIAFAAQYGELPPRPERDGWYSYYHKEPIIFDLFVVDNVIPSDLMPLLADLVLPLERFQLEGLADMGTQIKIENHVWDLSVAETELVGRADLLTYLQLVEQKQIKLSPKSNRLTAASTRKVYNSLMMGDFSEEPESITGRYVIRPYGLDVFAQEAGLMTRTGKLTKAGRTYLHSQDPEIFLTAFEKWTENGKFDEITRITELSGLKSRRTRLTPPADRREKVIEALSWCPVNSWISIHDFYRAVIIWDFDFNVEKSDYSNLYIGSRSYGELHGNSYWAIVNGLYINAIIWEYLGSIGAVDIAYVDDPYVSFVNASNYYMDGAYSLYDGMVYFRINNWGAFLLGQADTYEPSQPRQKELFTIDKTLRVHVVAEMMPNEQIQLEAIANLVDGNTYQLDTMKLLTAVENGQQLDQLIQFLEANHQGAFPASVTTWLGQLQQKQGAFIETETAVLITLNQPDLMTHIQKDKVLAKLFQPIDEKTILVPSSKLTRFRKQLKKKGYLLAS